MAGYHHHVGRQTLWMSFLDLASLVAAIVAAVWFRLGPQSVGPYLSTNVNAWVQFSGAIILANYIAGTYGIQLTLSRVNLLVNWVFSLLVGFLTISLLSYASFEMLLGRGVLALAVAFYAVFRLGVEILVHAVLRNKRPFLSRAVIVGAGKAAPELRDMVENRDTFPLHRVVAFIRLMDEQGQRDVPRLPPEQGVVTIDCTGAELPDILRRLDVDVVIVGDEQADLIARAYRHLRRLRFQGMMVFFSLAAQEIYSGRIPLEMVDDVWLTQLNMTTATGIMMRFKRMVDILGSIVAAIVCLPLMAMIALIVKVSDLRGHVIYSQNRVGHFGRVFRIHKFRTMVENAESMSGAVWSSHDDRRVTRIGRVLRKFRLDELPQLFNILKGDMSVVGPRPERPEIAEELEKVVPYYRERENVVPGLTGWAQIRYPYGASVEDTRRKLEYDLYYIKNMSWRLDLQIILRTIRTVLLGMERRVKWRAEAVSDALAHRRHPDSQDPGTPDT